jgi:formylglycine-generating enzyme required for sulfatase activity
MQRFTWVAVAVILAALVFVAVRQPSPWIAADERAPKPGDSFRECDACPEMVVVPAGSFMMGSPVNEEGRTSEEDPVHKVTIAKPFAVGRFEVTFEEWDACVADGGCQHKPGDEGWGRGKRPVINVSWNDITMEYLPWLRGKTGKTYRLLSEAEWEYAARAGSTTRFHFGDDEKELCTYGNVLDQTANEGIKMSPLAIETINKILPVRPEFTVNASCRDGYVNTALVGSFNPNQFGLYDMHGNVSELVQDCWWHSYSRWPIDRSPFTSVDGSAFTSGDCRYRVERSGSWASFPRYVRSAYRWGFGIAPSHRNRFRGFRVARTLD